MSNNYMMKPVDENGVIINGEFITEHRADRPGELWIREGLVRCKDCKHYQNEHICQYFSRFGTIETPSYGYCCFGERGEVRE